MPKTKFSIFFSWQSDTKGNRTIIRDSILAECQKQKEMNGYEVVIDEATRNLPGSPQIETSILQKIANSDVFICDITPYNFIIAAKNSPYNCSKFDATSEEYFNGMLDGIVSNEKFNDYMMRFPKREDF